MGYDDYTHNHSVSKGLLNILKFQMERKLIPEVFRNNKWLQ